MGLNLFNVFKRELDTMHFAALKLFLYKMGIDSAKPHPDFKLTKPRPKVLR